MKNRMEVAQSMKDALVNNFQYIQGKIEAIKKYPNIDIKMISDLERFANMQRDIMESISIIDNLTK